MQEYLTNTRTYTRKYKHKHTWHTPALHFRHVEVLKENIKDMYEYSYAVCQDCQDYGELRSHSCYGWLTLYPHRGAHYCSSIMPGIIKHYTFSLSSHSDLIFVNKKKLHDRRFQGKKFTQKTRNFRHLLNCDIKCVNALNWDKTSKKSLF